MKVGIVLLAAGGSTRLGRPKQLLRFENGTLLSYAARQAINSKAAKVLVVLGPHLEECRKELDKLDLSTVNNLNWQNGMASSIQVGVGILAEDDTIDAVLIMTCDQPHVKSDHLNQLINNYFANQSHLVATEYQNSFGIPALLGRQHFQALRNLQGDSGAKVILQQHRSSLIRIPLQDAAYDIDTEADYKKLQQHQRN